MEIGPRNAEEEKLNEIFEAACKAMQDSLPPNVELLVIMKSGDGIMINSNNCCVHSSINLAEATARMLRGWDEDNSKMAARN